MAKTGEKPLSLRTREERERRQQRPGLAFVQRRMIAGRVYEQIGQYVARLCDRFQAIGRREALVLPPHVEKRPDEPTPSRHRGWIAPQQATVDPLGLLAEAPIL